MRGGTAPQRVQVVAPFQHGNDTPAGMAFSHLPQLLGHPGVIRFDQLHHRQIVLAMRIKTCRDKQHFRLEILKRRQPVVFNRLTEFSTAAVSRQWDVHHARRTPLSAAVRIKRVLKR